MIPSRLCPGGQYKACQDCYRNYDQHAELDPKGLERPVEPDVCGGRNNWLPIPPGVPESRL